jgi:negative regulator of sigma E activity
MSANATPAQLRALTTFGQSVGLAFQVIDDILDVTQTTEHLGKTAGMSLEDVYLIGGQSNATGQGYTKNFPAGFRKILEMRRSKQGNSVLVTHMVYSDGLAAVSVFIEPAATRNKINEGLSQQGAINIYTRTINDQVVTVLGEAPATTIMQIANSVSPRGR